MSKVVKKVGRVFKKIGKAVKKIIKPLAIAVAAYFTAGVALSFIPATSAFAASLPGFAGGGILGTGVGAGATAGTGIFSNVASAIGLGGGLAGAKATAAASALAAGEGVASVAATYGTAAVETAMTAEIAGGVGTGLAASGAAATAAAGTQAAMTAAGAGGAGAGAAAAGMSLTDKLLLGKMGVDVAGALFGPTEADLIEEQKRFSGAFYGVDAGGGAPVQTPDVQAPALPQIGGAQQPAQEAVEATQQGLTEDGNMSRDKQNIVAGRSRAEQLFQNPRTPIRPEEEDPEQSPFLYGEGQMQQQIPVPTDLFAPAPGVRYV